MCIIYFNSLYNKLITDCIQAQHNIVLLIHATLQLARLHLICSLLTPHQYNYIASGHNGINYRQTTHYIVQHSTV